MQRPDMAVVGQRILCARQQRGWNQSELARQAGVHRATLALLEKGTRDHIRSDMLYSLACALGCTTDYLLGLSTHPRTPAARVGAGVAPEA
jgi:transcriptional regulator with XRE-family HTH domain